MELKGQVVEMLTEQTQLVELCSVALQLGGLGENSLGY